jgi:lincosamide nucleotidyltransferase
MNLDEFNAFTDALRANLEADPRVLGLIACGSMAQRDTRPDAWSDHDFLVVVAAGAQEELRTALTWLPDHARVVFSFRETAHGVKVLYEQGHMLEFAVFDPDELYLARINQYRVLLDRSDLARRAAEVAAATSEWSRSEARDDSYPMGQFLTGVLVAYGRWIRGERLSARYFLANQAVPQLLRLLVKYVPAGPAAVLDNVNPMRRFELAYGPLGAALNEALDQPLPAAAAGLLSLAERELAGRMPRFPAAALEAVRRRMA